MSSTPSAGAIVEQFLGLISNGKFEESIELLADGVVYENVGLPVTEGREAVKDFLASFLQLTEAVDWITHRQIEVGEAVANERTDRFLIKGNWVEGRVAGFFEVHDGQITLWRDYFDLAMLVNAFSA